MYSDDATRSTILDDLDGPDGAIPASVSESTPTVDLADDAVIIEEPAAVDGGDPGGSAGGIDSIDLGAPAGAGDEDGVIDPFEAVDDQIAKVIADSLQILVPVEPQPFGGDDIEHPLSKYDSFAHAQLCRMKMLGLSNSRAARAIGISANTLDRWLQRKPKLAADMERAAELANAHAALLLRRLMEGDGATAFNAVRFFLTTHSDDFQEKTCIEVSSGSHDDTVARIREGMYGLRRNGNGSSDKPALPVLPADSKIPTETLETPTESRESPGSAPLEPDFEL